METLIHRIAQALAYGMTGTQVAEHFKEDGTPEEIWFAYHAAVVYNKFQPEVS